MTVGISYSRTFPFAERTRAIGQQVRQELDGISSAFTQTDAILTRALRLPSGADGTLPTASEDRSNQVIGFDSDGNLQLQPGVGQWRGDWVTSTDYKVRDVFRDAAGTIGLNNLYIVTEPHTSTTLGADAANYELLINVVDIETAKVAAEAAQSGAETAETNASASASAAAISESNASNSETAAATSESNAATSASNAATSEANAATSETNASASETAAGNSKTYAQEWANKGEDFLVSTDAGGDGVDDYSALHQAKKAEASASSASTSASSAATSESNAATSASNAATSETNAANSASAASTSETNAASSESAAATSESNAAASEAAAAASYDNFDDRYLGVKTSDPTTDNDGDPLITGALYFNSTVNKMKVYNGTSWQVTPANALDLGYDNSTSGLAATEVQSAVDELSSEKANLSGGNSFTGLQAYDQMPEVSGNPIIARGSNSDGEWVRFADGTQICSFESEEGAGNAFGGGTLASMYRTDISQYVFSKPFSNTPHVSPYAYTKDSLSDDRFTVASYGKVTTTTVDNIQGYRGSNVSDTVTVGYIAKGRWF